MMKKSWFQSLSCASRGSRGKNRKRMVSVLDGYLVLFLRSTVRRLDYAKGRPQTPYCFSLLLRRDLSVRPGVAAVGQPAQALPLHPPPPSTNSSALGTPGGPGGPGSLRLRSAKQLPHSPPPT